MPKSVYEKIQLFLYLGDEMTVVGPYRESPVHQDPLENWRDGTASALGHVPELGRTLE